MLKNEFSHSWSWSRIQIKGPDASDFAHRMFSRNFKTLLPGEARLTLFLSPEGAAQNFFWALKDSHGLNIVLLTDQAPNFVSNVSRYHFAERFVISDPEPIRATWELADTADPHHERRPGEGLRAFWRQTAFEFDFGAPPKTTDDSLWLEHRIRHQIPSRPEDYSDKTLIFDIGLEELCDPNKGCYSGQEVVERLRTRAGHGPRKLVGVEWSGPVNAHDAIVDAETQEPVGQITSSIVPTDGGSTLSLAIVKYGLEISDKKKLRALSSPQSNGQILSPPRSPHNP